MSRQTNWFRGQQDENSRLDALLRRLAHESPKEAPFSVRQHIQSVIQQHRSLEPALTAPWLLPVAGIATALLVAVVAVLAINAVSNRRAENDWMSVFLQTSNRKVQPPLAIETQKSAAIFGPQAAKLRKRHRHLPIRNQQPAFVALPFSDPTLANGTNVTIRMTLSDAELLALGVAPDENKRRQLYVADVVLGDDGLPRAIRVLSNISGIRGGS